MRVSNCGGGLCGVVVWLKDADLIPPPDSPQIDDKNPNPALAKRPIIGVPLFIGMRSAGPSKWSGQIYNADDGGNSYVSHVSVAGPDSLRVEKAASGMLCGGETWSRFGEVADRRGENIVFPPNAGTHNPWRRL